MRKVSRKKGQIKSSIERGRLKKEEETTAQAFQKECAVPVGSSFKHPSLPIHDLRIFHAYDAEYVKGH